MWFGTRLLGPSTGLYMDRVECPSLGKLNGVVHTTMPWRVDMVFSAGSRVVGVESKKPDDLISSYATGRLARQLRILLRTCDVGTLLVRGYFPIVGLTSHDLSKKLWVDLVAWQSLGIVLLQGPSLDQDIPACLAAYKPKLADGRSSLNVLAWTDRDLKDKDKSLLEGIRGVGPRLSSRLVIECGSVLAALNADDETWKRCGASRTVIETRKEVLGR